MKVTVLTTETQAKPTGFAQFDLPAVLLRAVATAGYSEPKPIQRDAIPPQLAGRDLLGIAQTGSGKTAAFALPILAKLIGLGAKRRPKAAHALVLAPTRELAVQIEEAFRTLAKGAHISTALVLGGVSRSSQVKKIAPGVDVLIATPGRLHDLVQEGDAILSDVKWLVLDEADRMLDMGFIHQVKRLAKATSRDRQTMLFSATMPPEIAELAAGLLKEPVRVEVAPQGTTVAEIDQSVILARVKQKRKLLAEMLADETMRSVMVFARTKHGADRVAKDLARDGFEAAVIHGNKSQNARQAALNGFREGKSRVLVATDIAARGIDVPGISHVINFDLPDEAESYVHRIGRTGRNGASGTAVTLCAPDEAQKLKAVEKVIRRKLPVARDLTGEPDPQPVAGERPHQDRREGRRSDERPQRTRREHGSKADQLRQNRGPAPHGRPAKPQHATRPAAAEAASGEGFAGLPGPARFGQGEPRQGRPAKPDGRPAQGFKGKRWGGRRSRAA
ncbi:MAG TPA: DEAD/DEAH box helicase [Mesorhizobium sp.]|nr:DEAD/DEAH box helicase [Mesorhizobium sp.]